MNLNLSSQKNRSHEIWVYEIGFVKTIHSSQFSVLGNDFSIFLFLLLLIVFFGSFAILSIDNSFRCFQLRYDYFSSLVIRIIPVPISSEFAVLGTSFTVFGAFRDSHEVHSCHVEVIIRHSRKGAITKLLLLLFPSNCIIRSYIIDFSVLVLYSFFILLRWCILMHIWINIIVLFSVSQFVI